MLGPTAMLRSAAHYAFPKTSMRLIGSRHCHDEIELSLLPALVDADRDAVDVGANVGRYATPLARLARYVHVFEPHPRLARMLTKALPRNTCVRQVALSDSFGETTLQIPIAAGREDEGLAYVDQRRDGEPCRAVTVTTATLDTLCSHDVGFIKIDVEGHEMRVLAGARTLLSRQHPIVLIEAEDRHNPDGVGRVAAFFKERDYEGFFIHSRIVHPIGSFEPSMQDPAILARALPGVPRRDIPYVNNFIFVPKSERPADVAARIRWLLQHSIDRAGREAAGRAGQTP